MVVQFEENSKSVRSANQLDTVQKILTKDKIKRFLQEAPGNGLLLEKIIQINIKRLIQLILDILSDSIIIIKIPDSKAHTARGFVISTPDQMKIYPTYLNLSHPETYTRHCFRRSSAILLADTGADITTINGGVAFYYASEDTYRRFYKK
ncbi:hypothetical protein NQ317_014878 [Molorchus minor]|uniref:Peptidase A2 domain-containing protein n=1 Tax=Molorchus minor TaxID=1323400 RepID=A0ABQ9J4M1_9CUCU|nr:hypothetical protein NQ317_014878 [Molorchus minor]